MAKARRGRLSVPAIGAVAGLIAVAAVGVFLWQGGYDVGADAPHTAPVAWLTRQVRMRSIAARARSVRPPADLGSRTRTLAGASLYDDMCAECHLAPGKARTEISQGLYPPAPRLFAMAPLPANQEFWAIKHGVKLTAMPAWGRTHSDDLIWDMVAFLQRLPRLSAGQYRAMVAAAPMDHDEMMAHRADTADRPAGPAQPGSSLK
ncbi:MAG TPA: cytochrome c [Caulobacteraceae bacterium]|nr:cytochrome c [Caulobacteraceae bacterium]